MNRCVSPRRTHLQRRACLFALLIGLSAPTLTCMAADPLPPGHRVFPASALRGEVVLASASDVLLNGRPERLAPGARIRGENNELLMTGGLLNQRLLVHYTRERASGLLMDLWVLRAVERANRLWPVTEAQAQAWTFDPASQTWTQP